MDDIASMAHDVLLDTFESYVENEHRGTVCDALRDEILRRMDSTARRVDILPDGHRA